MAELNVRFPKARVQLTLVVPPVSLMTWEQIPLFGQDFNSLVDSSIEILCFYDALVGFALFQLIQEMRGVFDW